MLTVRDAIKAAMSVPHAPTDRLYTDGNSVEWMPQPRPGWFKLAAVEVRDSYEQTDASANCCDMLKAAA